MWVTRARDPGWILFAVVLALAGIAVWRLLPPRTATPAALHRLPPLAHRVTVEVLNGTRASGAARVGTLDLRQAGFDVVYYGNPDSARRGAARTVILVRRGDTTGVARARKALGDADVITAPDATRLVDLSVILGRDFAAALPARAAGPD